MEKGNHSKWSCQFGVRIFFSIGSFSSINLSENEIKHEQFFGINSIYTYTLYIYMDDVWCDSDVVAGGCAFDLLENIHIMEKLT